jgi:hypothetical protein
MAFNYSRCRTLILHGILESLHSSRDTIDSIEKPPGIEYPINGMSLDVVPWHGALGISLRHWTECDDEKRYCNTEWAYFGLASDQSTPALKTAADFIHDAYISENSNLVAIDMAHMIFMAGAEALLDPQVANLLLEYGINAPTWSDHFVSRIFEYMVFDFDGTVTANYCELVLANRVAARWRPKMT